MHFLGRWRAQHAVPSLPCTSTLSKLSHDPKLLTERNAGQYGSDSLVNHAVWGTEELKTNEGDPSLHISSSGLYFVQLKTVLKLLKTM